VVSVFRTHNPSPLKAYGMGSGDARRACGRVSREGGCDDVDRTRIHRGNKTGKRDSRNVLDGEGRIS